MSGFRNIPIVETIDELNKARTTVPHDFPNTLRFDINAVPGLLINPDFHLWLQLKVYKMENGARKDISDSDKVGLANYPLASLFDYATVDVRNKSVAGRANIAYVGYIRALKDFDKDGRDSLLQSSLWHQDKAGFHNIFEPSTDKDDPFTIRHKAITNGKTVDLYGPLMLDICRTNLPYPDDVDFEIHLYEQKVEFALNGAKPASGTTYHIEVIKAELCVTRLRMAPGTDIYKVLGPELSYPFTSYEMRHYSIPEGVANINEQICQTATPARVMIAFVDQLAFNGAIDKNPYHFDSLYIQSACLRKNQSVVIPSNPYTTELEKTMPKDSDAGDKQQGQNTNANQSQSQNSNTNLSQGQNSNTNQSNQSQGSNTNPGQGNKQNEQSNSANSSRDKRSVQFDDSTRDHSQRRQRKQRYVDSEDDDDEQMRREYRRYRKWLKQRRMYDEYHDAKPTISQQISRYKRQTAAPDPKYVYRIREYSRMYYESLRALNTTGGPLNRINQNISLDEFDRGYCILGFDLRDDRALTTQEQAMVKEATLPSTIRFEAAFHLPLEEPIILLCILEFPRLLNISKLSLGPQITVTDYMDAV